MKSGECKKLSSIFEKVELTLKQEWLIRDFINDVEDRSYAEGYQAGRRAGNAK